MEEIKKYHLYKGDYSKLHFQLNDAASYCKQNVEHCYKPHQHSFYQFIWFQKSGQHYVDYEVIEHEANTLFFLDKGQVHNFCKDSPNEGILLHFDEVFLMQREASSSEWLEYKLFNGVGRPFVKLPNPEVKLFGDVAKMLDSELRNRAHNYDKQVYHLFQILFLSAERLKQSEYSFSPSDDKNYKLVVAFKKLIQDNIHRFLSIDQYSEKLAINSKKLTALSKAYLNDTPLNVIHRRKILEAKRLLSNTNVSVKELAYKLGFDQPTYFTKYFKKHTGLTPKEFIKQML